MIADYILLYILIHFCKQFLNIKVVAIGTNCISTAICFMKTIHPHLRVKGVEAAMCGAGTGAILAERGSSLLRHGKFAM